MPYLRPTFWPSVPRLVNLLYAQVRTQIDNAEGDWGKLMRMGLQEKLASIKKDGSYRHNIYDPLVFSTIKAQAGGRLRMLMSGAAPIAKDVQEFMKVSFCSSYPEAYGMTETAGGSIYAHPDDPNTGHVGGIFACMKVRLRDIPEMGYYYEDPAGGHPKGEMCFKGTNIFSGYYK